MTMRTSQSDHEIPNEDMKPCVISIADSAAPDQTAQTLRLGLSYAGRNAIIPIFA
ncbi:hypothetical protein DPMN_054105 [Dreissena polymorpha]|uniref:Uncharacterized protein n=1 Tax=Dreissena polymorpha TaxID=45954 RepID=A0A9D4HSS9_DREPO|nr:hypothetical protein DPMN_054105 [Dreissena polymorpha]